MGADFSLVLTGDSFPDWKEYVRAADQCGFWGLGIGDSQSLYMDVYVRASVAAMLTKNLRVGPWVTNPLTRHPAVAAGAIASVDIVSDGRAVLGIGSGDSAALNIGLRPSPVASLEDYVRTVRTLLRDGLAEWQGREIRLALAPRRVPVYVAASGPKTVRMAGRVADGVIIAMGVTPDVVRDALAELRAGAEEAGRRVDDIDVWWAVMANLAEDDETALNELKGSLVTRAHHAFRFTTEGKRLPPEYVPAMQRIQEDYRPMEHTKFGPSHHARLADDLGLTPYLARRFGLYGSPEGFVRRTREAHAAGARKIALHVRVADKRRFLRLWRDKVMPHFV